MADITHDPMDRRKPFGWQTRHETDGVARTTSGLTPTAGQPICLELNTLLFARVLLALAILLVVIGTIANLLIYQVADSPDSNFAKVVRRFDLGHEPSLPAWFSSMVLLMNGAMLILIGWAERLREKKFARHWIALGIIFIGLSIDESVMFHEMLDKLIRIVLATDGGLQLPWVVLGFAFALVVFLAYAAFLISLPKRFAGLFIISGGLFVGGAVGMELVSGYAIALHGVSSAYHTFAQTVEESLEMAGSILFFYSLGEYWKHTYGCLRIESSLLEGSLRQE
jgi:hypothetical protein